MHKVENSPWVVLKYGGTSVSSPAAWARIADRVQACLQEGLRPVIVHSALSGMTNLLESLLEQALQEDYSALLSDISGRHETLARDLGVTVPEPLSLQLGELGQLLSGIRLVGEVSPRVAARVMATGELLASYLGAAYLNKVGVTCAWTDARSLLTSRTERYGDAHSQYLAASCSYEPDPVLSERLLAGGAVILTQGYVAANGHGETVVLGRGGSDTSAAYLAAKLAARRLEIWSDVPGMFTADPRSVPTARLLRTLEYTEAQEISTMGGKVLHPRSITPVRAYGIPLHFGCTDRPDITGTVVSQTSADMLPRVKAVSAKKGLTLVSMQTSGMWHNVGFLADAFACFKSNGLSVDLVSTSETNVTVSLDPGGGMLLEAALERLTEDLSRICTVELIRDCAAVSLIGRKIRAILHRLGPVLELFEEHRIHLLSQAASDLNFTVVVDQDQADRLVQKLHRIIIEASDDDKLLGPTWQQLFAGAESEQKISATWWRRKRQQLLSLAPEDSAAYVYDLDSVDQAIASLRSMQAVTRLLYAVKANWNPDVLARVHDAGLGFECVSAGEIKHVLNLFPGLDPKRILFTPNFAPASEYRLAIEKGVNLTLDSLFPLDSWPEMFAGQSLFIRLDMGQGRGHHQHVRTAGIHSKFGIPLFELDRLQSLIEKCAVRVTGLHTHAGSGLLGMEHWPEVAWAMAEVAQRFPDVRVLDLGGGLGVPERTDAAPLNLEMLDEALRSFSAKWPQFELWLEPGRYIVAGAGVLLARVTQTKGKGQTRFIGLNTGMNSLIRPMLYGAYHEIVNLTRLEEKAVGLANVVGPVCESGDTLGSDRMMPEARSGDVMLIANAGAYGRVMSSEYNLREPAAELIIR